MKFLIPVGVLLIKFIMYVYREWTLNNCPVSDFSMPHLPVLSALSTTTYCLVNFLRSSRRLPHLSENLALLDLFKPRNTTNYYVPR
ncbi:hypothetical protein PUN28_006973 [Cardiocondyla obscurior]|uniref:Secreted protein n=1 Tax=Cardiocondyla obscurior TaxID=286306 RepID=A0AAW2G2Y9_9HYME